jgi:hypothetical protein
MLDSRCCPNLRANPRQPENDPLAEPHLRKALTFS